jgi:predicted Zn finger-like uncharacterized protein
MFFVRKNEFNARRGTNMSNSSTTVEDSSVIEQYIGFTACDECKSRFRVKSKYRNQIGKTVRCPKCKNVFVMELVEPTPLELASIQSSEEEKKRPVVN